MPAARTIGLELVILGLGIGALVPIFTVVYPAAGVSPGSASDPGVVLPVIAANPILVMGPGALEVMAHVVGLAAVLGLWARFGRSSFLLAAATMAAVAWLSVDIVDNAIAYHVAARLAADYVAGSPTAGAAFGQVTGVVDAIRLGGHVLGGLWAVGLSTFIIRTRPLPVGVGWLGIAVGAIFAANLFVPAALNVSFLTVPAWLIILGTVVVRAKPASVPASVQQPALA